MKAQEDPEAFSEALHENSSEMTETDVDLAETVEDFLLNLDHKQMRRQGIFGVILSIIILVSVLINVPKMPIVTPAIASISALVGAIYCGIGILICMVLALIGCILVLVAKLQEQKSVPSTVA